MKIILIRHFMTQGNLEHRYIGTTDEPLLPGQAISYDYPEAEAVAVSPLKRCVETAEIIYPGTRSYVCEELRECSRTRVTSSLRIILLTRNGFGPAEGSLSREGREWMSSVTDV